MTDHARALDVRNEADTHRDERLSGEGPAERGRARGRWVWWPAVLAVLALLAATVVVVEARRSTESTVAPSTTPTPVGHRKYMVFMIDTVVSSLNIAPGDAFQRDVMGRTPGQIAENRAEAVGHFEKRFGLDFSGGDAADGAVFIGWAAPPSMNYRAYTMSGESVPATGWQVHDGGWMAAVGPGGATLRGDWGGTAGRWVPEGTFIPIGDYRIDVEAPDGSERPPIFLSYRAFTPVPPLVPGTMPAFSCELASPEFGAGTALGAVDLRQRPDGQLHITTRNVLTFT